MKRYRRAELDDEEQQRAHVVSEEDDRFTLWALRFCLHAPNVYHPGCETASVCALQL